MPLKHQERFFASFALLVCVGSFSLGIIATSTTWWRVSTESTDRFGLFQTCDSRTCVEGVPVEDERFLGAIRAFMVGGCFVLLTNIVVLALIVAGEDVSNCSKLAGALCLVAGVFFLVGSAVYTGFARPQLFHSNFTFGYSLYLAWSATIASVLATPFAFLARKT